MNCKVITYLIVILHAVLTENNAEYQSNSRSKLVNSKSLSAEPLLDDFGNELRYEEVQLIMHKPKSGGLLQHESPNSSVPEHVDGDDAQTRFIDYDDGENELSDESNKMEPPVTTTESSLMDMLMGDEEDEEKEKEEAEEDEDEDEDFDEFVPDDDDDEYEDENTNADKTKKGNFCDTLSTSHLVPKHR